MKNIFLVLISLMLLSTTANSQRNKRGNNSQSSQVVSPKIDKSFDGLKLRSVGPAFTSGRIADIAFHPDNDNVWYVAVGSGGVWKTMNSGITWDPIFDHQSVYSTGCITLDPTNPSTVWLGTGENVGGRHVGFGDGIYKSTDGGATWKNMGLKATEHISKIIVHPTDPNVIWVAAQGPLWSKGGERGVYKSTDGGNTWKNVLSVNEWTGATDLLIDPRNPDVLYTATWQRHRTIAAYMGGGPGSAIHRSDDGGTTWNKLSAGLPSSNLGKIGLALSPQKPDVVYAAIELDRTTGGIFKSTDMGASWEKQSDAVAYGTGPHYYQELYACPHNFDRIYLMNVRVIVSDNGGKTYRTLSERKKHSDNHAMAFRDDDPNYLLIGSDGGLYESFDLAKNWRFINNMPLTQYYKVAVDDREPFYHILGGTQDNGSHGGPSRTDNQHGIRNADWYKTLGADGHQSATEPGNPNISYAETQQGGLHRIDHATGEQVLIQPQAKAGEDYERYNWDAPIIVSPHNPARLYFASQRVWKSDDRGDSWTAISEDLTKNQLRIALPIMGKKQSWDNAWDVGAMSNFNTITSLSESPKRAGLIYAGTDDGIIQISENDGASWTKIFVSSLPGVPAEAFVNDIKADLHDENKVYVALDNHKSGDFKPYLYMSQNKGKTWTKMSSNIPEKHLVWRIVQDHVDPNLFFCATEFGIFFSQNAGSNWIKLKGAPTISFRDLAIQKRENDLVGASFGRSFYVLDDYSVLREASKEKLTAEGSLFSVRDAWWYVPRSIIGSEGAQDYQADNPPFGAMLTYHLSGDYSSMKKDRKKAEKELEKQNRDIPFPGWDAIDEENNETKTSILLTIKDANGNVVRNIKAPAKKGMNRVAWDLRYPSSRAIRPGETMSPWMRRFAVGPLAPVGNYTVSLSKVEQGVTSLLDGPIEFRVKPLNTASLTPASPSEIASFQKELTAAQNDYAQLQDLSRKASDKIEILKIATERIKEDPSKAVKQLFDLEKQVKSIQTRLYGNAAKSEIGERNAPTIGSRLSVARRGASTTHGPTALHRESLTIAKDEIGPIKSELQSLLDEMIPNLEQMMQGMGAPYMFGN